MKMTSETFDRIRFYAEILGHIFTFILAVSEKVGFKYGVELAGIVAAANICIGGIVDAARKRYNDTLDEEDDLDEIPYFEEYEEEEEEVEDVE